MTTYSSTPLFGGALIVDLPSTFADVSTIRQVPDHQEVYLDKDGFTSIIFDITERVGTAGSSPATDGAAMTTHLEDIVDSDLDTVKVWSITDTKFSKLPENTPAYTLIATQTPPRPQLPRHGPRLHSHSPQSDPPRAREHRHLDNDQRTAYQRRVFRRRRRFAIGETGQID